MKRLLSLLLAVMMILAFASCGDGGVSQGEVDTKTPTPSAATSQKPSEETPGKTEEPAGPVYDLSHLGAETLQSMTQEEILSQITPYEPKGQIIQGSTTQVNGDFVSGWTNSATNAEIKVLMGGYSTLAFTKEGMYIFDPVTVKEWEGIENPDGSKTYRFVIYDNLVYNDGTNITAKDYVGSLLIYASDEFKQVDNAQSATGTDYVGYKEYNTGESNVFAGVRLLGDYEFSVTIDPSQLPYFHDITMAAVGPAPIHVLVPGVDIKDDGNGAYFTEGFTAALLQQTFLGTNSDGYRYKPTVTSGPYQFVSYDPESSQAVIEANPRYLGDYDGAKAKIKTLVYKLTTTSTEFDELAAGQINIGGEVSGGDSINIGLDLVERGGFNYAHYPRHGYGKIAFACNLGPTQFVEVRQAIAWMLDRDEFARQYSKGFAIVVHGYYGQAQWEYAANKDALERELVQYTYNKDKAIEVLEQGGWTLDANGNPYSGTGLRHKRLDDGTLMPLEIQWMNTPDNPVSDLLNAMLVPAVEQIGMKIIGTTVQFAELLDNYYQDVAEPYVNMFNLGTGFNPIQYPEYYYNKDLATYGGSYNTNFIADDELDRLAHEMARTEPGDRETFSQKWLQFQKRWNYLLPDIPLYSDDYHVFFTDKLQNYQPSSLWGFEYAILRSWVSD
jgi:peptide/nickel transport system substrate-binding protein